MPVLINNDSGLAENLSPELSQQALQAGTHGIPLNDREGNPVIAPYDQAANLISEGHTQPHPEQLKHLMDYAKYSTTPEQIKTGLEGAGEAATFGLSTKLETSMGADPEAIRARREVNPISHGAGQAVGLGASMLTGVGEGALLEKAGAAVGKQAATLFGEQALGRIGTAATRMGIENMAFQGGDEVAKMFMGNPEQTIETAMADIGMAGVFGSLLGGGAKGTQELWALGPGKQMSKTLEMFKNRSMGLPTELKSAAKLNLAPEIEAALGGSPEAKHMAALLMESSSKSGEQFQKVFGEFKEAAAKAAGESLDKSPEQLALLKDMSKYETGKEFQDGLVKAISEKVEPIAKKYEKFEEMFKSAGVNAEDKLSMANKISDLISEQGLVKGPNESALKLAQKVLGQLDSQASAADLRSYIRGLNSIAPYGSENYQIAKGLKSILKNGEEAVIDRAAAGSNAYAEFKATQGEYGKFKDLLTEMNDRLHLGREAKYGAEGFMQSLREMDPESVVNRLKLKDDVGLQHILEKQFPEVNQLVKQQELNALIKKSLGKEGDNIDIKKLFKNLDAMSPELRQNLIPVETLGRLEALHKLVSQMPAKMNPSGTAKTLDALWNKMPASAMALGSLIMGHNPIVGAVLGQMAHWAGREAPDAVRLAMLKFLGSNKEVSAEGFKAAIQVARNVIKGEKKLDTAVKNVFEKQGVPSARPQMTADEMEKLKDTVKLLSEQPTKLIEMQNHTEHYLPDVAPALGQAAARNIAYLASIRPETHSLGVLDNQRVASKQDDSRYEKALQIAQNPLITLEKVKNGSLTLEDMHHLHAMYPALAMRMREKLQTQMIEAVNNDIEIPYTTKLSLSSFLGQPLEYSMQPLSIQASQPVPKPMPQQQNAVKPSATSTKALQKLPQSYSTPEQAREADKTKPH